MKAVFSFPSLAFLTISIICTSIAGSSLSVGALQQKPLVKDQFLTIADVVSRTTATDPEPTNAPFSVQSINVQSTVHPQELTAASVQSTNPPEELAAAAVQTTKGPDELSAASLPGVFPSTSPTPSVHPTPSPSMAGFKSEVLETIPPPQELSVAAEQATTAPQEVLIAAVQATATPQELSAAQVSATEAPLTVQSATEIPSPSPSTPPSVSPSMLPSENVSMAPSPMPSPSPSIEPIASTAALDEGENLEEEGEAGEGENEGNDKFLEASELGENDLCEAYGGQCTASKTNCADPDETLTCKTGKCCFDAEEGEEPVEISEETPEETSVPTQCGKDLYKCMKDSECKGKGEVNASMTGCTGGSICCEMEQCEVEDGGKCKQNCGEGEYDSYDCTFGGALCCLQE